LETNLSRIHRIPDILVNQIAAGEVVERPASALKELIENSLDAGCRRIEVLLNEGGMAELTVIDDGSGIHPDDLALCLERHATSKIRASDDLESISTYGFRGEALASIASVAEVELKSRTAGASSALCLAMHYGEIQGDPRPVAAPQGTAITVRNLFARLPARQKFLRSASTEFSHCARVVKELAVGNPQVSFALHHQGRRVNAYIAPTREGRIQEAFSWSWKPLRVEEQADGLSIDAFLTPGDRTSDRGELLLYINQRPVRNRGLLQAVRQAYSSTLGPHHEPSGVVYLDIRKDWVDVNVHPQKTEVRCLRQENLYSWLLSAIRKAIALQPSIRSLQVPTASATPPSAALPVQPYRPEPTPFVRPVQIALDDTSETLFADRVAEPTSDYQVPAAQPSPVRQWRYLGQAKAAYLICEDSQGVLLVDQHALHEKFRFEELRRKVETEGLGSQRLLLPRILRLPSDLAPLLEESHAELSRYGFEIEPFGDGDWAIKALPELVSETEAEAIVLETLREIRKAQQSAAEVTSRALTPVLATIACHSVVRAGQVLSSFEAEALLENIDALELGWTCPHGRPVVFRVGYSDIEKHFERK
jgi:DNA mismatch repair protein MutL